MGKCMKAQLKNPKYNKKKNGNYYFHVLISFGLPDAGYVQHQQQPMAMPQNVPGLLQPHYVMPTQLVNSNFIPGNAIYPQGTAGHICSFILFKQI